MKMPLKNSLKVFPILTSLPKSLNLIEFSNNLYNAISGAKCPNKIPAAMAVSTQNVKLVSSFFIKFENIDIFLVVSLLVYQPFSYYLNAPVYKIDYFLHFFCISIPQICEKIGLLSINQSVIWSLLTKDLGMVNIESDNFQKYLSCFCANPTTYTRKLSAILMALAQKNLAFWH